MCPRSPTPEARSVVGSLHVLALAVLCLAPRIGARAAEGPSKSPVTTKPAARPITIADRTIVFPAPNAPARKLARAESAAVSDSGRLCAVLNRATGQISSFDVAGKVLRRFTVPGRFATLLVSNLGMLVLFDAHRIDPVPSHDNLTVVSPEGKVLKRLQGLRMGTIAATFLPKGDRAVIAAEQRGAPHLHQITASGDSGDRVGPAGHRPGALVISPSGGQIACSMFRIAEADEGKVSDILLYDVRRAEFRQVRWNGTYVVAPQQMAFSPDDRELVVAGPGSVKCYDTRLARQKWRRIAGHVSLGTLPVQKGLAVSVVGDAIVTAHGVPTGPGYKYLISVFERDGRPRYLFIHEYRGRRRTANSFVTPELPPPLRIERLWDVGADGRTIQLNIPPKKRIDLTAKL